MSARSQSIGLAEYPPRRPSYAHMSRDPRILPSPVEVAPSPGAERTGMTAPVPAATRANGHEPQGTRLGRGDTQEPPRRAPSPGEATPYSGKETMKYGLLWLLGVPIPFLIVGYLIFH